VDGRSAVSVARLAVSDHELAHLGGRRLGPDEERVAEPGGAVDGRRRGRADPDFEAAGGDRRDAGPRDRVRRVGADLLARAEAAHDVERRFEQDGRRRIGTPSALELLRSAAERALHDERAGRDRRQGADLLGHAAPDASSGNKKSAPAGRSSHSAEQAPSIGTFW
jgi:hypothetical protein